jgi:hypothetical protein
LSNFAKRQGIFWLNISVEFWRWEMLPKNISKIKTSLGHKTKQKKKLQNRPSAQAEKENQNYT